MYGLCAKWLGGWGGGGGGGGGRVQFNHNVLAHSLKLRCKSKTYDHNFNDFDYVGTNLTIFFSNIEPTRNQFNS